MAQPRGCSRQAGMALPTTPALGPAEMAWGMWSWRRCCRRTGLRQQQRQRQGLLRTTVPQLGAPSAAAAGPTTAPAAVTGRATGRRMPHQTCCRQQQAGPQLPGRASHTCSRASRAWLQEARQAALSTAACTGGMCTVLPMESCRAAAHGGASRRRGATTSLPCVLPAACPHSRARSSRAGWVAVAEGDTVQRSGVEAGLGTRLARYLRLE
jgi:hypothetical protein